MKRKSKDKKSKITHSERWIDFKVNNTLKEISQEKYILMGRGWVDTKK